MNTTMSTSMSTSMNQDTMGTDARQRRARAQLLDEAIGAPFTATRLRRQLTQDAIAEALDVTRRVVSSWECGEHHPRVEHLVALRRLLLGQVGQVA